MRQRIAYQPDRAGIDWQQASWPYFRRYISMLKHNSMQELSSPTEMRIKKHPTKRIARCQGFVTR